MGGCAGTRTIRACDSSRTSNSSCSASEPRSRKVVPADRKFVRPLSRPTHPAPGQRGSEVRHTLHVAVNRSLSTLVRASSTYRRNSRPDHGWIHVSAAVRCALRTGSEQPFFLGHALELGLDPLERLAQPRRLAADCVVVEIAVAGHRDGDVPPRHVAIDAQHEKRLIVWLESLTKG